MNDSNLTIRVPVELRDRFLQVCKANDVSAAQILRAAMRAYLESNAQSVLPLEGVAKPKGRKFRRGKSDGSG